MTDTIRETLPTRFRFASGDIFGGRDDLAATLQARLRVTMLVGVTMLLAFFVLQSIRLLSLSGDARVSMATGQYGIGLVAPPVAMLAWWLRRSRPRAIGALRWLEAGFFLSFSLFFALWMAGDFPTIVPVIDSAPLDLGLSQAVWMSLA